ncbi:MAG: penicillin-binding transpeptidase domain-containing protein, partial [Enterococcus faecalis]|nr:penicillin-binding transpeptidase domain-containing protein [Enterococcus faecalis]
LTIDSNFQNKVDEILQRNYSQIVKTIGPYSENAYVVAMNPQTGAILAMSGVSHDLQTGEVTPNPLGPILNFEVPGSVVKAGTLTAGYEAKVLQGNDTLLDEPIILAGTNPKASWWNSGGRNAQMQLTAEQALEYSSNAYMMKVVFKLMGVNYYPNMVFPYEIGDDKVFKELRNAYAEYGMGIKTGIDLPGESPGYVNKDFKDPAEAPKGGNLLDLSFGQYDNYTPLQLAQYVSTVANNGIRVQPHVVEGIYGNDENGALGKILKEIEPKVLNKVNISEDQIGILQQGFYNVVNGTSQLTTAPGLKSDKFSIAAKTGTAETQAKDANGVVHTTVNSNLVAYAPYENPEIAISVVLPHLNDEESKPNQTIAKEVLEAYMEMYKK